MQKKVTFITFDILSQIAPLAGGYLQGYACTDPLIREAWEFEHYVNLPTLVSAEQLTTDMLKAEADVYAFSCYAWNMGLFKQVLPEMLKAKPQAHIILGGPQVMNCAGKYLSPEHENLVLCNGEGEKTFKNYLTELMTGEPDFARVKGLSFYRDGRLMTTTPEDRIKELDEIPSPILEGLFDPTLYHHIFIETNRGCPFTCHYCYWGGAIGAKVNKFSEERIRAELEWIARNNIYSVVIVDANWGILQRDVELSRFISELKAEHGAPQMVGFSGSKNTPERVSEITKIFYDAGLLLNHTISLQTMQETTLKMVGRQNIKTEAYMSMQRFLNDEGISSHIELIWPLPGETLSTFKDGIDQLCAKRADMFFCHPLYLINNIELNNRREEYGIVTEESTVVGSEAEVVVQTKDVSYEDYLEGWRFLFTTIIMHNLRSLYCLSSYLDEAGIETHGALFAKFLDFLKASPAEPLAEIVEAAAQFKSVEPFTLGRIAYYTHDAREEFDSLLFKFASSQAWWTDDTARLFFEVDLLNRPHFYAPDLKETHYPFEQVNILEVTPDGYVIEIPPPHAAALKNFLGAKASFQSNTITINHRQSQPAYTPAPYKEMHWMQCYHAAFTVVQMSPTWLDASITAKAA